MRKGPSALSLRLALGLLGGAAEDLTPEQLDRLATVAREMNEAVRAAERTRPSGKER